MFLALKCTFSYDYVNDYVLHNMLARVKRISRYKYYFSYEKLKVFCDSLVLSLANYCTPIWAYQCATKLCKINKVIEKMTNEILLYRSPSVKPDLLDIVGRRELFGLEFIFKHVFRKS